MARPLTLSIDGEEYQISLVKVDRDKLYGWTEIEAFDEKGREAELRVLAADGKTLIDKGGTALATVTDKGDSVDRNELVPINREGKPIEQVSSSFGKTTVVEDGTIEGYFSQIIKSVYFVMPFENSELKGMKDILSAGRIFTFPFSWRGGIEHDTAYLIGAEGEAFIVTGKQSEFEFIKLNQSVTLDNPEEEDISADDLDFDLM